MISDNSRSLFYKRHCFVACIDYCIYLKHFSGSFDLIHMGEASWASIGEHVQENMLRIYYRGVIKGQEEEVIQQRVCEEL